MLDRRKGQVLWRQGGTFLSADLPYLEDTQLCMHKDHTELLSLGRQGDTRLISRTF